jgi:hypothetical protein
VALVSKTNARSGISPLDKDAGRLSGLAAQEHPMLDVVMLALGLGFFAVAIGYTYACERL